MPKTNAEIFTQRQLATEFLDEYQDNRTRPLSSTDYDNDLQLYLNVLLLLQAKLDKAFKFKITGDEVQVVYRLSNKPGENMTIVDYYAEKKVKLDDSLARVTANMLKWLTENNRLVTEPPTV